MNFHFIERRDDLRRWRQRSTSDPSTSMRRRFKVILSKFQFCSLLFFSFVPAVRPNRRDSLCLASIRTRSMEVPPSRSLWESCLRSCLLVIALLLQWVGYARMLSMDRSDPDWTWEFRKKSSSGRLSWKRFKRQFRVLPQLQHHHRQLARHRHHRFTLGYFAATLADALPGTSYLRIRTKGP